jgi:hypothetical protein
MIPAAQPERTYESLLYPVPKGRHVKNFRAKVISWIPNPQPLINRREVLGPEGYRRISRTATAATANRAIHALAQC